MKALRLLILVSTVTVLGACGGKKGSKPNMLKPTNRTQIVKSDQGYMLDVAGQCADSGLLETKADICQFVHDEILKGGPCIDQLKADFVANKCDQDITVSQEFVEEISDTTMNEEETEVTISKDSNARIIVEESDEVIYVEEPVVTVTTTQPEVVETEEVVEEPVAKESVSEPVVETSDTKEDVPVLTVTESVTEAKEAEAPKVEEPAAKEAAKTQVVKNAKTIRFFPEQTKTEVQEVTPKVFAVEREISEETEITNVTELPRDKVEMVIKLDSRLPLDKKMEVLCEAKLKKMCELSYSRFERSERNRCVRRVKVGSRDMNKCIKKETENYTSSDSN